MKTKESSWGSPSGFCILDSLSFSHMRSEAKSEKAKNKVFRAGAKASYAARRTSASICLD